MGPVRGLTWPILITRDCALTGMTLRIAGAAMAPRPAFTSVRRLMRCIRASLDSGIAGFFQVLHDLGAQRGLLLGAPLAEAFARFEAEFAFGHELFKIRRRAGPRLDVRQHGLVDRQREVGADQISVLERPQYRE